MFRVAFEHEDGDGDKAVMWDIRDRADLVVKRGWLSTTAFGTIFPAATTAGHFLIQTCMTDILLHTLVLEKGLGLYNPTEDGFLPGRDHCGLETWRGGTTPSRLVDEIWWEPEDAPLTVVFQRDDFETTRLHVTPILTRAVQAGMVGRTRADGVCCLPIGLLDVGRLLDDGLRIAVKYGKELNVCCRLPAAGSPTPPPGIVFAL